MVVQAGHCTGRTGQMEPADYVKEGVSQKQGHIDYHIKAGS